MIDLKMYGLMTRRQGQKMRKSKSQSLEGLNFVKQVLPPDLHQFAHLIPLAVNHHVSWLEPDRKEYALTVALAAFDKAVKKRRGDSTDAEFGQYAKQCICGVPRFMYQLRSERFSSCSLPHKLDTLEG